MSEDAKISELNETSSLADLDWFTILDQSVLPPDGDNTKIRASNVRNYMSYISQAQATELTGAGATALHYHGKSAETLEFVGTNPIVSAASASNLIMSLSGAAALSVHNAIGGESFFNIRIGNATPPTCIIVGATNPGDAAVVGLLTAVSFGSMYIWTNPGNLNSTLYTKQKDGGGNPTWDSKA